MVGAHGRIYLMQILYVSISRMPMARAMLPPTTPHHMPRYMRWCTMVYVMKRACCRRIFDCVYHGM